MTRYTASCCRTCGPSPTGRRVNCDIRYPSTLRDSKADSNFRMIVRLQSEQSDLRLRSQAARDAMVPCSLQKFAVSTAYSRPPLHSLTPTADDAAPFLTPPTPYRSPPDRSGIRRTAILARLRWACSRREGRRCRQGTSDAWSVCGCQPQCRGHLVP